MLHGEDSAALELGIVDEIWGGGYNHVDIVHPLDSHESYTFGLKEVGYGADGESVGGEGFFCSAEKVNCGIPGLRGVNWRRRL